MNSTGFDKKIYFMQQGERSVFRSVDLSLSCISGILWITWPGSDDVILTENQMIHVETEGKICVESLAESTIEILSVKEISFLKFRFRKFYRSGISCFRKNSEKNMTRNGIIPMIR